MIVSIILNVIFVILTVLCVVAIIQRKKQVKKNRAEKAKLKKEKIRYFIHQVELAKTLRDLYLTHIRIWANGIKNKNFGPDKYGMFRTDDILMMTPDEVFLGNIWGLWTKPLTYWENQAVDDQKLVIEQYKNVLISNMKEMQRKFTN